MSGQQSNLGFLCHVCISLTKHYFNFFNFLIKPKIIDQLSLPIILKTLKNFACIRVSCLLAFSTIVTYLEPVCRLAPVTLKTCFISRPYECWVPIMKFWNEWIYLYLRPACCFFLPQGLAQLPVRTSHGVPTPASIPLGAPS